MSFHQLTSVETGDTTLALERIVFFSDAVMAIAITLLAIDLRLPDRGNAVTQAQLDAAMNALQPKLISFLISFLLIGIYWMRHLRVFRYIKRFTGGLLFLNLLFLLSIALLPFTSNLVGAYAQFVLPNVVYALNAAAVGIVMHFIWWYASVHHRLIDEALPASFIHSLSAGGLGSPIAFLISIPVAFINAHWAQLVWWILPASMTLIFMRIGSRH